MNAIKSPLSSMQGANETFQNSSASGNNDNVSSLPFYSKLDQYEQALSKLVGSVDNFKPDIQLAHNLIKADSDLVGSLKQFSEYNEINVKLLELKSKEREIEDKNKKILLTLNECYTKLNLLPMVEQVQFENEILLQQRQFLKAKDVLDYAMKLSKFTKVPPTFDKGMIGPINFIWPGDDSLRRGMLATADLEEKEKMEKREKQLIQEREEQQRQELEKQKEQEAHANGSLTTEREESIMFNGQHKLEKEEPVMFNGQHKLEKEPQTEQAHAESTPQEQDTQAQDQSSSNLGESKKEKEPEEETNHQEDEDLDLDLDLFNPDEF